MIFGRICIIFAFYAISCQKREYKCTFCELTAPKTRKFVRLLPFIHKFKIDYYDKRQYNFYVSKRLYVASIKYHLQILQSEVFFAANQATRIIIQKGGLMKRRKKSHFPRKNNRLCRASIYIFQIGLPLIILYLSLFLATLLSTPETPGYVLSHVHRGTLEYIVMSATIITVGGFGFDMIDKAQRAEK